MAEERQQETTQPTEEESSVDRLLGLVKMTKPTSAIDIEQFSDSELDSEDGGRMAAAVRVFLDAVAKSRTVERVDTPRKISTTGIRLAWLEVPR